MGAGTGDPTVTMWEFLHGDRWIMLGPAGNRGLEIAVPLRRALKYEVMRPLIVAVGAGMPSQPTIRTYQQLSVEVDHRSKTWLIRAGTLGSTAGHPQT